MVYWLGEGFGLFDKFGKKEKSSPSGSEWKTLSKEERQKRFTEVRKVASDTIKEIGPHKGIKLSSWYTEFSEDKVKVLNGESNEISLITTDAWDFTDNKARDDDEYIKYEEYVYERLLPALKNKLSKYGKVDSTGDWDDDDLVIFMK